MNVLVAGGSGTIGLPLVRALVRAGHRVTSLSRSTAHRRELIDLGASVAQVDALNRDALIAAIDAVRPTHVIHELTALPKDGVRRSSDIDPTNRLRIEGTRNLLDAAIRAGARRFIAGSFAIMSDRGGPPVATDTAAADAVRSMEKQVLDATQRGEIEGIILRYGLFYGPEVPSTVSMIDMVKKRRLPILRHDEGQLPLIHIDDAVSATVRALDHGPAGGVYDIVDDRAVSMAEVVQTIAEFTGSRSPLRVPSWLPKLIAPYMARMMSVRLPLSNSRAGAELGWRPGYPSMREGLAGILRKAA